MEVLNLTTKSTYSMGLKVGITGGIGSGKSTVCSIFSLLGVPIYYADQRARELMESDQTVRQQIVEVLGKKAYVEEGHLNRPWIASQVFPNPELLRQLNEIVHPAVARDGEQWQTLHHQAPYTLKEAALLYESGSYMALDKMIEVFAPKSTRIHRVMQRDGLSRAQVQERMDRQWPEWKKLILADMVIINDGRQGLINQVLRIHRALIGHH